MRYTNDWTAGVKPRPIATDNDDAKMQALIKALETAQVLANELCLYVDSTPFEKELRRVLAGLQVADDAKVVVSEYAYNTDEGARAYAELALEQAAEAQTEYWDALRELETCLGTLKGSDGPSDLDDIGDLTGYDVDTLLEYCCK